jgi:hypothetical protein
MLLLLLLLFFFDPVNVLLMSAVEANMKSFAGNRYD